MFYLGTKREKFVFKFFPQSQVDSMFKQLNEKAFCQFPVRLDGEDYIIKICNVKCFNYSQYKFMFIHDSDVLEFHSRSLIQILERFLIDVCEFEPDYPVEKIEMSEWKHYKKRSRIY